MAYTTFSTDNADYVLQLGNHLTENKQVDIFAGIDALVIETGLNDCLQDVVQANHPQMNLPISYCMDHNIPIFRTDVKTTAAGFFREIIAYSIEFPISIPLLFVEYILSKNKDKKMNDFMTKVTADYDFLFQTPIGEGRNSINARKIEEFVVPFIDEELKRYDLGRKAQIGLIFGAGHTGLKADLQSKKRRDFTLWNWRNCNFGKYAGFEKEDLNLVEAAVYNGEKWLAITWPTNLFD